MAYNEKQKETKQKKWKIFKADLKNEEYEEATKLLKENNLNKAEFVRLALKNLKNGTLKKEEIDN